MSNTLTEQYIDKELKGTKCEDCVFLEPKRNEKDKCGCVGFLEHSYQTSTQAFTIFVEPKMVECCEMYEKKRNIK